MTELWNYENRCWEAGYETVCGVDEAGRGPLAGPVCAAAVILPRGLDIPGLNDSKKLTAKRREALYDIITEQALAYGIAFASELEIDEINILQEMCIRDSLATVPSDNLNLLYTPLCGTGNKPVRTVLGRIGVNVAVVPAQEKPDGDFKTCEYPNPETDAALNESYKIARETHPDLILGTDPDCDLSLIHI